MATTYTSKQARIAGWVIIVGTITMAAGAVVGGIFGVFVDDGLKAGTFGEYLTDVVTNSGAARANMWLSIFGVIGIGLGGYLLTRLGDETSLGTKAARFSFTAGTAAAIVFFPMILGVIEELAPRHVAGEEVVATARTLAYIGTTADWIASALILGLGIGTLAYAGRSTWVPRWLFRWAMLASAAGAVSMIEPVTGASSTIMTIMSIVELPVAMPWMIAAGIVAIRYQGEAADQGAHSELPDYSTTR